MSDHDTLRDDAEREQRNDDEWRADVAQSAWSAGINAMRATHGAPNGPPPLPAITLKRSPSMDSIGAAFAWCMQQPGQYLAVSVVRSAGRWYATLTTEAP